MFLIVGLGNPESDYARTRHNIGFDVVNALAKQSSIEFTRNKFNGIYGKGIIENNNVILVKPQTYMNLSGECIIEYKNFYKLNNSQIIVISDDIDLSPGSIRIRKQGGPGTHNGLKSVVQNLNATDFIRVRVGIGMPQKGIDLTEHVIGYIDDIEYDKLQKGVEKGKNAIIEILKNGIDSSMNKYNVK